MHVGVSKRKNWEKRLQDQQRLQKKLRFLFKTCFSDKPFLVYKKIIYFSKSIFPGVTGNILEEYVDLTVTQHSADHFASHETIEGSKQVVKVITCFIKIFECKIYNEQANELQK